MTTLPPRRNPTPTKISKQHLTPIQILLQMGFPKHRVEKALAATGNRGVQLASDWLLAHVNDPLLDDNSPREYILYACPTGSFLEQLKRFWERSFTLCGWNGAHNFTPHITLVSFFKASDEDSLHLSQGLKTVMDKQGATLNEPLKLETYTSPNFMGFFVAEEHADYLKRIAMQYVKEVSNATISLEPHVKSLHLTLAYQFPNSQYVSLKTLVDELDPELSSSWELRLYSRDPRVNGKQVNKVVHPYIPSESDELELRTGDFIYISSDAILNSPDGWVEGISWLTGVSGFFPESYTQRTAESDAWTLHKKISLNQLAMVEVEGSLSKESKPSTSEDVFQIPSTIDETFPEEGEQQKLTKVVEEGKLYENLLLLNEQEREKKEREFDRSVFIMRHGERIDFTFGSWVPFCFDKDGSYVKKDLNMPKTLPYRQDGQKGFSRDSPLTNIGLYEAALVGEALKESNVEIHYAYSSPSYRCIQTCDAVLRELNKKDEIKIRVEHGLFEWLMWYPENIPNWMSLEELKNAGYNVDENYTPLINEAELRDSKENCEQFYLRSAFIMRGILSANPMGNILLVGHSATLETCSHELVGKKPRLANEMTKLIQKIPYCSFLQLDCKGTKWTIVDPPCTPITHSNNPRFDWKIMWD